MEEISFPLRKAPASRTIVERAIARQMPRDGPEFMLAAAVLAQAVIDQMCLESASERRSAEKFFEGSGVAAWCHASGLEPDAVRKMAREWKEFKTREMPMFTRTQTGFIAKLGNIGYGSVTGIEIIGGKPRMGSGTKVIRSCCFGRRQEEEPNRLKAERHFLDFFEECERIGNGIIRTLDFQRGMPVHMTVEAADQEAPHA